MEWFYEDANSLFDRAYDAFYARALLPALLTIDRQRRALEAIHRHLEGTGGVALNLFYPRLDLLIDANITWPQLSGTHTETGCRYEGEMLRTSSNHSTRFAAISGATPRLDPTARCLRGILERWRCAGPFAGSYII